MSKRASLKEVSVPFFKEEDEKIRHPVEELTDNGAIDRIINIPIDRILVDTNQIRKNFDQEGLEELAQSIKRHGLIQPIVVTKKDEGFKLVAGERRFRACQIVGLKKIKATVTRGDPLEIALIENIQREDLSPIEEAEGYQRLIEMHSYTQEEVAEIVGKSQPYINKTLALTELTENIKKDYIASSNRIPRELLYEVTKQTKPEQMEKLYNDILTYNLTVREVRKQQHGREHQKRPKNTVIQNIEQFDFRLSKFDLEKLPTQDRVHLGQVLEHLQSTINQILGVIKDL